MIKTVLFLTIQFSRSYLFAHSLNVKKFYLTHKWDPFRCYRSGTEWTWEYSFIAIAPRSTLTRCNSTCQGPNNGSNGNYKPFTIRGSASNGTKVVLHISESSSITWASPSDCLGHIQDIRWRRVLTLLQRCSRCILQPQPTRLNIYQPLSA